MKHLIKSALALSILAITATSVSAQDRPRVNLNQAPARTPVATPGLTYTYAGARYVFQNLNDLDCDQDGINIYGSLDIKNGFFARASFIDVSGDKDCGSSTFSAGGGYRTAFNQNTDMYAVIGFGSTSVDVGEGDSGLELAAGMRSYLKRQLEGSLELFHTTSFEAETGIRGGLVYWFNRDFAMTGDLGLSADSSTFAIGARMAF